MMGKGNKTLEEELDEDNQNEQELDFELYEQGSVGGQRLLDSTLERKESVLPGLSKFTSVFAPLPIRREQSFQYLVDPSLMASTSLNNPSFMQMPTPDNYQENYSFGGDLEGQKDEEYRKQSSLFSLNRNESNNFYYNNMAQDDMDQDGVWVDVDDSNDNQINKNNLAQNNLNRGQSQGQIQKYESVVDNDDDDDNVEEDIDNDDVQQLKPEQFIQIESSKNLKSNKQMKEKVIEISADDEEEVIIDIFSDEGAEEQKKSAQSLKSIKIVDIEAMEEEKRKKIIKPIRKNSSISRDFIDLEDDQEIKENYKLTHAEEFGIISNMNDWMNLSRNNMRLRLLNRKYQSELNREKNVQIKKTKGHQDLFEKMKKKLKKLIISNQQLADSNKEIERRYKETVQQFQRVTTELTEKQKSIQDLHCQLTNNETSQIELKTVLQNKESEIEHLKNSIKICEETAARISQKKALFNNSDNNFIDQPLIEKSAQINEIQQKIGELSKALGEKNLGLSSSDDMFQIFCVLHRKILSIQQDNQKKDEVINRLEQFKVEKNNLELRARIAEDEFESAKKNSAQLSHLISEKDSTIQQLTIQVRNIEQLTERNEKLQVEATQLQQEKLDKERLLMEQEVIHQIKIDNILDGISNPQQKNSIKKQLEELMDINQIASSTFIPQQIVPSTEIRLKKDTARVKINKKKADVNEECILLKKTLQKMFNWEIQYVGSSPIRFNLVDKKNAGKKQISINLAMNQEGEIEITNKQYLLKSVRKLWKMLNSDLHMTSLRSCVENFWLITALQLKEYLDTEEKEFNKQMEIQSQNDLAQKGIVQEDMEQDDNMSSSSSLSSSGQLEQEVPLQDQQDKKVQNMEESQNQLSANKLQEEEEEIESEKQEIQIDEEEIQEQIDNEDEDKYDNDEAINNEDSNQNDNQVIQNKWDNNYDQQDDDDDSQLLKELQQDNDQREENEEDDEDQEEDGEIQYDEGSDSIQQEDEEEENQ